jgi:hypothetical protein
MWKSILVVVALLTPFAPVVQAQDDLSKVNIRISKLAGNVYLLVGDGGNIAASIGEDGIVIVDDQYAPLAENIQSALKGISDKPIRFVINTHLIIQMETNTSRNRRPSSPTIMFANVWKTVVKQEISPRTNSKPNLRSEVRYRS